VHISELAPHHVESPREIVHPGDEIRVKILEIDSERRRLSLSAKRVEDQILPVSRPGEPPREPAPEAPVGEAEADAPEAATPGEATAEVEAPVAEAQVEVPTAEAEAPAAEAEVEAPVADAQVEAPVAEAEVEAPEEPPAQAVVDEQPAGGETDGEQPQAVGGNAVAEATQAEPSAETAQPADQA
jgi:small subunit ribosomal protein S1